MGLATQYIGKLSDGLRFWLQQPPKREMLHEIRVHIKKFRALWLIHPTGNIISFRQSFPHLRKLFRKAALPRDLHTTRLCLAMLPAWEENEHLHAFLETRISLARAGYKHFSKKPDFLTGIARDLHHYRAYYDIAAGFLLRDNRRQYRLETLEHMALADGTDDKRLHELRKRVKNTLYQAEAFDQKTWQGNMFPGTVMLQQLQEELGSWHDWWFAVDWLKNALDPEVEPMTRKLLNQAERKEGILKREVLRTIKKCDRLSETRKVFTQNTSGSVLVTRPEKKVRKTEPKKKLKS